MNCPNGARQFAIIEMISTQIYLDNNTDTDTDRRHKLLEAKRGELASQPKPANAISMTYFWVRCQWHSVLRMVGGDG